MLEIPKTLSTITNILRVPITAAFLSIERFHRSKDTIRCGTQKEIWTAPCGGLY